MEKNGTVCFNMTVPDHDGGTGRDGDLDWFDSEGISYVNPSKWGNLWLTGGDESVSIHTTPYSNVDRHISAAQHSPRVRYDLRGRRIAGGVKRAIAADKAGSVYIEVCPVGGKREMKCTVGDDKWRTISKQ